MTIAPEARQSRSGWPKSPHDFYATPFDAVRYLAPYLQVSTTYVEPFAGDGALMDHLSFFGHTCAKAYDIKPRRKDIQQHDVINKLTNYTLSGGVVITNPPWSRHLIIPYINYHMNRTRDTGIGVSGARFVESMWLLLDSGFKETQAAAHLIRHCRQFVPVRRQKWIAGTKHAAKKDCGWYLFEYTAGNVVPDNPGPVCHPMQSLPCLTPDQAYHGCRKADTPKYRNGKVSTQTQDQANDG